MRAVFPVRVRFFQFNTIAIFNALKWSNMYVCTSNNVDSPDT